MEWRIDTSTIGEVKAADLRVALERSRDHWIRTQPDGVRNEILSTAKDMAPEQISDVAKRAEEAKAKHIAKHADILPQMSASIESACAIATSLGGVVTCTIAGHHNRRHASGAIERISISVDRLE